MYYTILDTSICPFLAVGDENGLNSLIFIDKDAKTNSTIDPLWIKNDLFFEDVKKQIIQYIDHKRKKFDLKLDPKGTEFQKKVWRALSTIPYGEYRSYSEIACQIGNDKAVRAVGMANSKNPLPLIIPCHRVIGKNGKLVGYAGGLRIKKTLLKLEGIEL